MHDPVSILIVEDESLIAMLFQTRLARAGFTVCDTVATGEDAIAAAVQHTPDFILMDIRLGGALDGIMAARQIRRSIHTRIIYMTGYSNETTMAEALQTHPVAYLVKPVDFSELLGIIRREMERARRETVPARGIGDL